MSLIANRNTPAKGAQLHFYPVAATTHIYKGALVCLDSSGNLVPGSTSTSLTAIGRARKEVDNSAGLAGALSCPVEEGTFQWANGNSITQASAGAICYVVDDQTVSTNASGKSPAGTIDSVDANGVWVKMGFGAPYSTTALTTFESNLATTGTGAVGANLVGVQDAEGNFTAASTVESALAQAMDTARSVIACPIPAYSAIANSGVLFRLKPGYKGRILGMHVQATAAVTTGSKLATLTPKIGSTAVTGGVVSMTSAGQNAIGATQDGTAVTALDTFAATDEITVVASSVTAFAEGSGVIYLALG